MIERNETQGKNTIQTFVELNQKFFYFIQTSYTKCALSYALSLFIIKLINEIIDLNEEIYTELLFHFICLVGRDKEKKELT